MPYPPEYDDEPDCPEYWQEYLDAFWLLNTSRPVGFGLGYIPLSEVEVFCRMFDIADAQGFVIVIRHLDRIYIEYQRERQKDGRSNSSKV